MKDEGQVFTTDMIFALILAVALLSISTQAYGIASGQIRGYSTRYSLERVANDTADILVKTSGDPIDWETHPSDLKTLGLSKLNPNNRPIPNLVDSDKISKLAGEIYGSNWNPSNDNTDSAIMEFFGGKNSVDNFGIKIIENGETIYYIWPGKEIGEKTPSENALEVAAVNRLVYGSLVHIASESPPLLRKGGAEYENLKFWIYPGELKSYNWYLYIENLVEPQANWEVKVWINSTEGETNFHYKVKDMPKIIPDDDAGLENEDTIADEYQLSESESNFISVKITGVPEEAFKIYVVALPGGINRNEIAGLVEKRIYILQIKVWR